MCCAWAHARVYVNFQHEISIYLCSFVVNQRRTVGARQPRNNEVPLPDEGSSPRSPAAMAELDRFERVSAATAKKDSNDPYVCTSIRNYQQQSSASVKMRALIISNSRAQLPLTLVPSHLNLKISFQPEHYAHAIFTTPYSPHRCTCCMN